MVDMRLGHSWAISGRKLVLDFELTLTKPTNGNQLSARLAPASGALDDAGITAGNEISS